MSVHKHGPLFVISVWVENKTVIKSPICRKRSFKHDDSNGI